MSHLLSRCPPVVITGGAILLATLLRWVLAPLWGSSFPYITYYPAIIFTTLVAGWKQGVAATLLAGICVPLLFSDPVFGVQQAAAWVFFVIVNLLLVVLCERIQSGQQLAEQAFHTSEARFLNFMTHLPGLAWIKDRAGRYVFVNDAAAHAFGRPREQVYGKTDDELFSPDTAHLFRTNDQKVLASRSPVETVETLVQEDGLHYSLVNKFPIPIDGDGTLFIGGIALDVTRNRQDQEALRQSQERLAGILTTAMDAIISVDSRQIITLFNGAAERMFGCTAAEAIGRPIDQFIPERYREAHRGHVEAFGRTGVTTRRMGRFGTIHGVRVNGEEFPLEASISQLELNGDKLYTVILRDITERERAEEALRLSEERFRLATAIGKVGVWEWDIVHNVVSWTDSLYRLHGVRPGELPMTVEGFSRLVHPEDRCLVRDAIAASLEHDRPYELEFRAQRPDGEVIWLFTNAVVLRESGRAIRMIGATADITPSKRMTEQLKLWNDELERRVEERTAELEQSQHRLRSLAMELNLAEQRERKRIASELHDYLAQLLVLGRLKLGQAKQLVSDQQSRELLVQVEEVLKESLAYTRNLVHDLSPRSCSNSG
ncbi:MAG TPA: PAS domain S-box protein [Nitrospiraceae bacterium]|nr:PAS domain S-box protein [Nitrospiraceae bacterium]